jgi:UDP-glucose:(glucosyl)LPS alpha-1,2-glucosyltransferase
MSEFSMSKGPSKDGTYEGAMGGTEMMMKGLKDRVSSDLLEQFQIICSRVRELDNKPRILWLHDLWNDPEAQHLKDEASRKRFEKLVFVSNYQLSTYSMGLGVPYSESVVLKNAIEPIEYKDKKDDVIRLIYHTTPHRGLNILVAAFEALAEDYKDKIHLDVYSSFAAYGWPQRDEPYYDLFDQIEKHPHMTYHGYQPNDTVRKALQEAHIFAYPNTWIETSCIAAIEAMSAGCQVVCPNLGALPETTGGFATMYQYNEDVQAHANYFANILNHAIQMQMNDKNFKQKMLFQKNWVDNQYNWNVRSEEWTALLKSLSRK